MFLAIFSLPAILSAKSEEVPPSLATYLELVRKMARRIAEMHLILAPVSAAVLHGCQCAAHRHYHGMTIVFEGVGPVGSEGMAAFLKLHFVDLDQVGVTLETRDTEKGYFIAGIAEVNGKPAVEGIQIGDKLVQVDERSVMLAKAGKRITLTLTKDGQR